MNRVINLILRKRTGPQKLGHESKTRYNVLNWGRQSGKTTYGLDKLVYKPLTGRPGGVYWYVLQTWDAAQEAFRLFKDLIEPAGVLKKRPNESDRMFTLLNNARVFFKSGKNYEDLRMATLDGLIIDEYRQQHPDLWTKVLYAMTTRRKAWVDFLSTPNGFDHWADLCDRAKADKTGLYSYIHAPSWAAPWWTPEEIEIARGELSEKEFKQEIGAEFVDMISGRAYHAYGTDNHRSHSPFDLYGNAQYVPFLPILVGMDFNKNPMAWVIGQYTKDRIHYSDEVFIPETTTEQAAPELARKLLEIHREWKVPLMVHLLGDATGKTGNRQSNISDYHVVCMELDRAKIPWKQVTGLSNPAVKDRVTTANSRFKSSSGLVSVTLNPQRCPKTDRCLNRTLWAKNGLELDPGPKNEFTHASDAATYPIAKLLPLQLRNKVAQMKVIIR